MATHPKLVVTDVLVADTQQFLDILVHDGRELFDLVPLRVEAANLVQVGDDVGQIDLRHVDQQIFGVQTDILRHHSTGPTRAAPFRR